MLLLQVLPNKRNIRPKTTNDNQLQQLEELRLDYLSENILRQSKILLYNLTLKVNDMAAIPQGAFAACKLRERFDERDLIISRMKTSGADKNSVDNQQQREFSPVKYNGKLMNSIWGLYNRYSPHNVKKNEYVPPKY